MLLPLFFGQCTTLPGKGSAQEKVLSAFTEGLAYACMCFTHLQLIGSVTAHFINEEINL